MQEKQRPEQKESFLKKEEKGSRQYPYLHEIYSLGEATENIKAKMTVQCDTGSCRAPCRAHCESLRKEPHRELLSKSDPRFKDSFLKEVMLKLILWGMNRSQKIEERGKRHSGQRQGQITSSAVCARAHQRMWQKGEDASSVRFRLFLHAS